MSDNRYLFNTAVELAKAVGNVADENLPGKLSGIVKLHAGIAVASAWVPVPGADMAAAGVNIWTMYVRINRELDLPFSENLVKSVAAGVVTNLGGGVAMLLATSAALKFLPGIGTLGGAALMSATIFAVTITAGIVYMQVVTRLLKKKDATTVTEHDIKAEAEVILEDKEAMKEILNSAKKDYKSEKHKRSA